MLFVWKRVVAAVVVARVSLAVVDPLAMDEEDEVASRVVRLFGERPPLSMVPAGGYDGSMKIRDHEGGQWVCRFPRKKGLARLQDDGSLPPSEALENYEKWRRESTGNATCADAPWKVGHYWAYRLCAGKVAEQIHEVTASPAARTSQQRRQRYNDGAGLSPSKEEEPEEEASSTRYRLGVFSEEESGRQFASFQELESIFPAAVFAEEDGVATWPSQPRAALVEKYVDGNDGRSFTAYVACLFAESEVRPFGATAPKMAERARQRARFDEDIYSLPHKIRIVSLVEKPEKSYHALVAAPTLLCARADLADAAVNRETKLLRGSCLRRKAQGDWWTYEVCVGSKVSQYHAAAKTKGDVTKTKEEEASGFNIGLFSGEEETLLERNFRSLGGPAWRQGFQTKVQHYTNGHLCDLTKTNRSASVHFRCDPETRASSSPNNKKMPSISSIVESMTCEYDILVSLPAVCSLVENDELSPEGLASRRYLDCEKINEEEDDELICLYERNEDGSCLYGATLPPAGAIYNPLTFQQNAPQENNESPDDEDEDDDDDDSASVLQEEEDDEEEPKSLWFSVNDPDDPLAPLDIDDEHILPAYFDDEELDVRDDEL